MICLCNVKREMLREALRVLAARMNGPKTCICANLGHLPLRPVSFTWESKDGLWEYEMEIYRGKVSKLAKIMAIKQNEFPLQIVEFTKKDVSG